MITIDTEHQLIREVVTPPDVETTYSMQQLLDNIARVDSTDTVDLNAYTIRHDARMTEKAGYQDKFDQGIAGGLTDPRIEPEE